MGVGLVDAAIPDVDHLLDEAKVLRAAAAVGLADDDVLGASRRTTAWDPAVECVASFVLRRRGDGGLPVGRDVFVVHATSSGWRMTRAADDPVLTGLAKVLTRRARVVSYKPGASCVVELGGDLLGKVVPPADVMALRAAFDELSRVAAIDPCAPAVPPVRLVDEDLGLLVMTRLPVLSMHRLLDPPTSAAVDGSRALGAAMGALHAHADARLPRHDIGDDVYEVRRCLSAVRAATPPTAARIEEMIERALALVAIGDRCLGPTHGALRTDQVLLAARHPVLVDLDGACTAPPERDLANLTAYLSWRAIRRPADAGALRAVAAAAQRGWTSSTAAPPLDSDRLRGWQVLSLLKIAGRRYRSLSIAEWPLVPKLLDEAARNLDMASSR